MQFFKNKIIFYILYVITIFLIWEGLIKFLNVPDYIIPSLIDIFKSIIYNINLILLNTKTTFIEVFLGFLFGFVSGFLIALLMFYSPLLNRIFQPLLIASQVFPKEALAPLFLVWFGFGIFPKILIAALISFFPITINTYRGINSMNKEYLSLFKIIGASKLQIFIKLRLPFALPYLFSALRVSATLCVIGAVVGEFVGSSSGLGHLIRSSTAEMATELIFASLFFLALIGAVFYGAVVLIENVFFKNYKFIHNVD